MATKYEERERKDSKLVEDVLKKAELAHKEVPQMVNIGKDEHGYTIIRVKDGKPGVRENKVHSQGYCLEPEDTSKF